ncbi:conserved protein of unknown function [Ectopseudomonas oleovorans]|uniref:Uncharacterized protein n=1 Tax=Ectopseudomonas oleovorans TaxID=301 RepID=A0A653BC56_ECTOL|nr:conserved protein of unknown function [Pseudomonas oleovorans]
MTKGSPTVKNLSGFWQVYEYVDKGTHQTSRRYLYKNKPCSREVVTGRLAEQFAGYSLIDKDVRSCISWLREIERLYSDSGQAREAAVSTDREKFDIVKGLYVAILTFYGKCFSECKGRKIKLERKMIAEEYRFLHDHYIQARNNFAAHSGAEKIETCEVVRVSSKKRGWGKGSKTCLFVEINQPDVSMVNKSSSQVYDFMDLLKHVKSLVEARAKKLEIMLLEENRA